jgi:hypothetical protein
MMDGVANDGRHRLSGYAVGPNLTIRITPASASLGRSGGQMLTPYSGHRRDIHVEQFPGAVHIPTHGKAAQVHLRGAQTVTADLAQADRINGRNTTNVKRVPIPVEKDRRPLVLIE